MKAKYKLPMGTKDYLPEECYKKNSVENKIMATFFSHGYRKVETPHFEYYDMFSEGVGEISAKNLFKMTDVDGGLLILRPDMTMPISRIVSTKLEESGVVKYCYLANSFSMKKEANRLREFTQCGVELIAPSSVALDSDMILLAIESLLSSGLSEFQLDVGQVAFFRGLLDELKLSKDDENSLIELIDRKDMLGVDIFAKRVGVCDEKLEALLRLPSLFGGVEVLDEAMELASNETSRRAIEELKKIYDVIEECGYKDYITFDLSLVNGVSYYTGVVFKGITRYFGEAILSGGRYDSLCSSFDKNKPAIGFAIGVDHLMRAIEKSSDINSMPIIDYVVGYSDDAYRTAYGVMKELRKRGFSVDNSYASSVEELSKYRSDRNAKRMVFVEGGAKDVKVRLNNLDRDVIIRENGEEEEF